MSDNIIKKDNNKTPFNEVISDNLLFLSVSESAKIGGVTTKTIRRAIQAQKIKYKIVNNRYQIDFVSLIQFLHLNTKLKNKLYNNGIGKYIKEWK